jgi:hypothetical protein
MEKSLPVWTTKAGRPIRHPVEWNLSVEDLSLVPPYGPPQVFWASPEKYRPATLNQVADQSRGRETRPESRGEKSSKAQKA